jgi:hypothetical protein
VRFVTLAALCAAGCTRGAERGPELLQADKAAAPQAAQPARAASEQAGGAPAAAPPATLAAGQASGLEAMAAARKLIRTGQITLVVGSFGQAAGEVKRIAEANGGYLAESQAQRGAQDRQHGSLTIRVDAARFDAAVAAIRALGDVRSEAVGAQDVTKAYTDLETRLRVKRETAARLRAILQTRTAALDDVLQAERELARVTEETEQLEGERRFYDQQVALSTLTVTLQEPAALVEAGVFAPLSEALHESLRVLAASLAAIVYVTVFLVPWVLIAWMGWKLFRRARARARARRAPEA